MYSLDIQRKGVEFFMMISPEMYVDEYVRGKSKTEMLREIKRLKQQIGRLKSKIEKQSIEDTVIAPSYDTQLYWTREYMKLAIAEYENAGGEYRMSAKEKKIAAFDADIAKISSIELEYGGFFAGTECRKVSFDGDEIKLQRQFYNGAFDDGEELFIDVTKADFLEEFERLHIGEWKHEYVDIEVLDGVQWKLVLSYTDGRQRKYGGKQ